MASTGLMAVVLVFSYVLMFGLVKFAENIIGKHEDAPAGNDTTVAARLRHDDSRAHRPAG